MAVSQPVFTISSLRATDAAAVAEAADLVNLCYRGEGSWTGERGIVRGTRITAAVLAEDLADPAVAVLLARTADDAPLLACVRTGVAEETVAGPLSGPRAAYLGMLAVRPDAQKTGVGRAMVAEVARRARDVYGCARVVLDVLDCRTELVAWYTRQGFEPTGAAMPARPFMEAKGEELLVETDFIVLEKTL